MTGARVLHDGDVEFVALEREDLAPLAVVPQCLDPHWVPAPMLRRMLTRGESLGDVAAERLGLVRAEYLRALVNARQVVVSRTALLTNPALVRDVLGAGDERAALARMLDSGALVPLLLAESSPADRPHHRMDERAFAQWQRLCRDVRTRCLRLSWDDELNSRVIQNDLHRRFGWFASGVHQLDVRVLSRVLGVGPGAETDLAKLLARIALWCAAWAGEGRAVTRDDLYREFVVADGTRPAEGRYDRAKPFAGELKRLLDLRHGMNLPDALRRFPLVPADGLARSALQEWHVLDGGGAHVSVRELADRVARADWPLPDAEPCLESFGVLSLAEVEAVRRTEAWATYAAALDRLLERPLEAADPAGGAVAVCDAYVRLVRAATDVATRRRPALPTLPWAPALEFVVEAGGAALSIVPGLLGRDPRACRAVGVLVPDARGRPLPVTVKLLVRGLGRRRSRADVAAGVHVLSGCLEDAGEQWRELLAAFGVRPVPEDATGTLAAERQAAMERCLPEPVVSTRGGARAGGRPSAG
jgi:hypothetical protein